MIPGCDCVVAGGKLVFADKVQKGSVWIREGKMVRISEEGEPVPSASRVIDATGLYVLPGLIDSHVHFRTPGLLHKETWLSASRAAAAGGITTVLDMPNTVPYTSTSDLLAAKERLIRGQSYVDFGFHVGVVPGRLADLMNVDPAKAASIKLFMTGHHTAKHVMKSMDELEAVFEIAAKRRMLVTVHAEDDGILSLYRKYGQSPNDLAGYERHLPRAAAIVAVGKLLEIVRKKGTQVHVLHVSCAEEAELLAMAAKAGYPVTFESTPHQLWFDAVKDKDRGARIKLSPAIRQERDRLRLWEAALDGAMASVGSDHAPHTLEEKAMDFDEAPPGIPGVQEMLSVLVTGLLAHAAQLSEDEAMSKAVALLAEGPAATFRLQHRKGRLAEGMDADIVLFDLQAEEAPNPSMLHSSCGWTAYEGELLRGRTAMTLLRGEVVYENGTFGSPSGQPIDYADRVRDEKFLELSGSPYRG